MAHGPERGNWPLSGSGIRARPFWGGRGSRRTGRRQEEAGMTEFGDYAENRADRAADRSGDDQQTSAIGLGLSAVAYALLEVAAAIRENTEARQ